MKPLIQTLSAVIIVGMATLGITAAQDPSETDYDWVSKVEKRAFEALMPLELRSRQIVAYRSDHDFQRLGDIERHFTITYALGEAFNSQNFAARVVVPVDKSIQRQLLDLHMADRSAPFEAVLGKIAVRRLSADSSNCPALKRRIDALSEVTVRPFEGGETILFSHAINHRIVVRSFSQTVDATVLDEKQSLVRWALQTNDELVACGHQAGLKEANR